MRVVAAVAMLALAGCASVPPAPVQADWTARRAQLAGLDDWRMTGRVAVIVDDRGASASIDWRQRGAASDVAVSGPLGVGALRVELDGQQGLRMEDSRGAHLEGQAARDLLAQKLGTEVPLRSLRYWLLGIPAPGQPVRLAEADGGFVQDGWSVGIGALQADGALQLPVRLTLERDGVRLKVAADHWEVPP